MKKQLIRLGTASTLFGLVLGTAAVAGASTGDIYNTGPGSTNKIEGYNKMSLRVHNDNDVNLSNNNPQNALTGKAEVEGNTTGGDATSGNATNESMLDASVSYDNSGFAGVGGWFEGTGSDSASIDTTGPGSYNKVEFKNSAYISVCNDNNVNISNTNQQSATSGKAEVEGNTTGGNATSGDAHNSSSSSFDVSISN